jgi:hypothetical protein
MQLSLTLRVEPLLQGTFLIEGAFFLSFTEGVFVASYVVGQ